MTVTDLARSSSAATERSVRLDRCNWKSLCNALGIDLPSSAVNQIRLIINLKTARALRLAIPQSLLLRAGEVIE
jgi:hypothetical protein